MKEHLETIEWLLSVILSACASVGMWLVSVFIGNLIWEELSMAAIAVLFVCSVALTWAITEIRLEVRYRRLVLETQEVAQDDP